MGSMLAWLRQYLRQRMASAVLLGVLAGAWAWRLSQPMLLETLDWPPDAGAPRVQVLRALGPGSGTSACCTSEVGRGQQSMKRAIKLHDPVSGRSRARYRLAGSVVSATLSPRGDLLALNCFLHPIYADRLERLLGPRWARKFFPDRQATLIVDVVTGRTLADLPACQDIAFSADGKKLALVRSDEMIVQFWQLPPRWLLGRYWKWLQPWSASRLVSIS